MILAAAVLTDARATGETGHIRAAHQTGIARDGRSAAWLTDVGVVTDTDAAAKAGTAARTGIAPVAVARAGVAMSGTGSLTLRTRGADAGSAWRPRATGTADQAAATGVARPTGAAATFIVACGASAPG
jgi:hypothetical protein